LKRKAQPYDEFIILPKIEYLLTQGTKRERAEYCPYLTEMADTWEVYAYTAACVGTPETDNLHGKDFWRFVEADGSLTRALHLWQQSVVFTHWAKVLENADVHMRELEKQD
jgi:hypothetical protein